MWLAGALTLTRPTIKPGFFCRAGKRGAPAVDYTPITHDHL